MPRIEPETRLAQADDTLIHRNLVVRDNLGYPVPIAAAELDVVETYLDAVLRDLLAPAAPSRKEES